MSCFKKLKLEVIYYYKFYYFFNLAIDFDEYEDFKLVSTDCKEFIKSLLIVNPK